MDVAPVPLIFKRCILVKAIDDISALHVGVLPDECDEEEKAPVRVHDQSRRFRIFYVPFVEEPLDLTAQPVKIATVVLDAEWRSG